MTRQGSRRAWRRFARDRAAMAGLSILVLLALGALAAPLVAGALGVAPDQPSLLNRFLAPSALHPLGTDELGRDVLVRLLYAGRVSLAVGIVAALASAVIGTLIGLAAGWLGGIADAALMRLTDSVIALPLLPLLIVLSAVDPAKLGLAAGDDSVPALLRICAIVALVGWTGTARLVRAGGLAARERDYVRAARALGAGGWRIAFVHVLPEVASPAVVAAVLAVGNVVLLEAVLSFLGLGIRPPTPSWGNMLTGAQDLVWSAPWLAVWPGLAVFATVVSVNLVGDGLQAALDPRAG